MHKNTLKPPAALEATRQEAVDEQAASDVWRGVRPVEVFGKKALNQKDYPDWYGEYSTKSTNTAADLEADRVAKVKAQAASDVWRGVKPVGVFAGALAQDDVKKDYPEYVDEYHKATMATPDAQ